MSAVGGVMACILQNQLDGTLKLDEISAAVRTVDDHFPKSRLVLIENTANAAGGTLLNISRYIHLDDILVYEGIPLTAEYTRSVAELAHKNGMQLHIDGARIFNASAALKVPVLVDLHGRMFMI